eukprot:11472641-Karenia_brevis.AAC.1
MGAVPALSSFLGPLYAWTASVPGSACLRLPIMVKIDSHIPWGHLQVGALCQRLRTELGDAKTQSVQDRCNGREGHGVHRWLA